MKKLLAVLIPVLLVTVGLFAQQQLELPLVSPKPAPTSRPSPDINPSGLDLPPVSPRSAPNYGPEQVTGLPNLSLPPVSSNPPMPTPGGGLPSLNLPPTSPNAPYQIPESRLPSVSLPQTEPDVTEPTFEDFTGGWNTENFPDNIDDKDAQEIENFIWSKTGQLEPRPGYDFYNDTEIDAGEHIWGLYPWYTTGGDKIILVGMNGTLWADTGETINWAAAKTGLQSNDKYYDFATVQKTLFGHLGNKVFVTHEEDFPFILHGTVGAGYTDNEPVQVGFAEYFSGYSQSVANCTNYVEVPNKDWELNQWAGYLICDHKFPSLSSVGDPPLIIFGNTSNTLLVVYNGASIPLDGANHIFGLFDYDSIGAGTSDSVRNTTSCSQYIDGSMDAAWDGKGKVVKMTSGPSTDLERVITYADAAMIRVQYPFDSLTLSGGDNFLILQKVFWRPRLCQSYKNRVFLVTENKYPNSGNEFIVFSEYNDPTHFDPDNFFTVKTGGGDKITALATFYQDQLGYKDDSRDGLVIFKENSIFMLTFIDATNYYLTQVVDGIGCVAGQTVQVIENKYMLFLHSSGVYAFDGRTVTLLTKKIHSVIEDIERNPNHDLSVAGYDDRHYYLSVPTDTGTTFNGEFITTFELDYAGTGNQFVHLITTLDGEQGGDIQITDDTSSIWCDIASDTLGNYCVLIKKALNLFLFRFDSLNARVGETIKINDIDQQVDAAEAHVDMNNNGRVVVVWEDFRDSYYPSGPTDVYGQYLRFSTGKAGSNFHVNSNYATSYGSGSEDVSVAINDDSICVFTWQEWSDPSTDFQTCIFAAIDTFSATDTMVNDYFTPWGGWYTPNGTCILAQNESGYGCANGWWHPDVDAGDTTFVIVCIDDPMESYVRYIVMNYDLDTLSMGITGQVEMNGSLWPSVSMNKKGRFVVTWMHVVGLGSWDAWARKYDIGGAVSGSYFRVDDGPDGFNAMFPAVALNDQDHYCIVWWDARCGNANYYRCYTWGGGAVAGDALLNDICDMVGAVEVPEITAGHTWPESGTTQYTLALSTDFGGWSRIVNASAGLYASQKGLTDTINMIFSDPANRSYVYEFGKVFQDTGQDISVLFKSKAFDFGSISNQKRYRRFFVSYYLDEGSFDLTFYTDFGDTSRYTSSVSTSGGYRYARVPLDWKCRGRNFSYKIESTDDLRIDKIRLRLKVEED